MSGILATTTSTVNAILTSVSTVAHSTTRAISAASSGLDMLESYTSDAKQRQADSSIINRHNYRKNLLLESAVERQRSEERIASEMHANPQKKQHFDSIHAELEALFN